MTKVWGVDDPSGPLQFSTSGARETAITRLRDGDRVVLVGTLNEPTVEAERGRVLAMMEPTHERVATLDFALQTADWDFDEEGNYKWPFSLHVRRAWLFDEPRPLLAEVSARRFHMDAAQGIVPLLETEAAEILARPHHEIGVLPSFRADARILGNEAIRRRGAPPPTTTRTGVMHMRRAPAHTYLMAVLNADTPAFKIGWAFRPALRERQFNQASMPTLGGLRYETKLVALWPTAMAAFRMEQALLRQFDGKRHKANREVIWGVALDEIQAAWVNYLRAGPAGGRAT